MENLLLFATGAQFVARIGENLFVPLKRDEFGALKMAGKPIFVMNVPEDLPKGELNGDIHSCPVFKGLLKISLDSSQELYLKDGKRYKKVNRTTVIINWTQKMQQCNFNWSRKLSDKAIKAVASWLNTSEEAEIAEEENIEIE